MLPVDNEWRTAADDAAVSQRRENKRWNEAGRRPATPKEKKRRKLKRIDDPGANDWPRAAAAAMVVVVISTRITTTTATESISSYLFFLFCLPSSSTTTLLDSLAFVVGSALSASATRDESREPITSIPQATNEKEKEEPRKKEGKGGF